MRSVGIKGLYSLMRSRSHPLRKVLSKLLQNLLEH